MNEIGLVNVTGRDRPGLAAHLMGTLARYNVNILDIGQAVIHEHISLGILVEIPVGQPASEVLKDLLLLAHNLEDVQVRYSPIQPARYEAWVEEQGKERRIVTLMGRKLTAAQIEAVARICARHNLNIDVITRLSGRVSLERPQRYPKAAVQLSVSGRLPEEQTIRAELTDVAQQMGIDVAFHMDDIYRRNRRLVAFDMDSTLVQIEGIDELAKIAGVGEQVAAITAAAMRGEIDFRASLTQRVALLAGLDAGVLEQVAQNLPLMEGAEQVTSTLKRLGYKLAIISGGFDYFGRCLQERLGFDYLHANRLEVENGKLTGRLVGAIIDGPLKAGLLQKIATKEGLSLEQTIAVGDGANDLPMLLCAGLGVAFHAKPIVREQAGRAITTLGLDGLLFLIGVREREINSPSYDGISQVSVIQNGATQA